MATGTSEELGALAQRVADALPTAAVEEVVLTGSVSRGVADDVSDIEMLIVMSEPLELGECFGLARAAGLDDLGTWGAQEGPARRVSGRREGVPIELIWWPREYADTQIDRLLAGEMSATADALAHGVALRTSGLLAAWQDRLRPYPPALAAAQIEQAALPWGGFAPAGVLTLVRPGDRLALVEWLSDGALGVLKIVFALNHVWRPTTKRLAARVAPLAIKPDRLAERIEEALTEPDSRRALRVMTELQLDTVGLAPSGPNIDRARSWLTAAADVLGQESPTR
jgi:predicted nucleotidyltransferase